MKSCDCEESRNTGVMDGWEWCPYCGCELEEEEKVKDNIFCEQCGALIHYDNLKCSWCGHVTNEVYGKSPLASAGEALSLLELSKRVNNDSVSDIADALSKKSEVFNAIEPNPAWDEHLNTIDMLRDDVIDSMRIPSLMDYDKNGAAMWVVEWGDVVETIFPENKNWRKIL